MFLNGIPCHISTYNYISFSYVHWNIYYNSFAGLIFCRLWYFVGFDFLRAAFVLHFSIKFIFFYSSSLSVFIFHFVSFKTLQMYCHIFTLIWQRLRYYFFNFLLRMYDGELSWDIICFISFTYIDSSVDI
jgi:hypothetical protein